MNAVVKFKKIAEGWKGLIFLSPSVEAIAIKRSKICSECPLAVEKRWLKEIGKRFKRMKAIQCSQCNCVVSAKTRVVSETCPHPDGPKW